MSVDVDVKTRSVDLFLILKKSQSFCDDCTGVLWSLDRCFVLLVYVFCIACTGVQ